MKLWQKDNAGATLQNIIKFTVGKDRELDVLLAPFDVLGSMAHAIMLEKVGLLSSAELTQLLQASKRIFAKIEAGEFEIDEHVEDVHSQVEFILTEELGDVGKKIHSGRSRNDQVLVDMKMYLRYRIQRISALMKQWFEALMEKSELHKNDLLPGYTHLQIAMPSSFGLWFAAYAESLGDDLVNLKAAFDNVNRNPLGSGAGYGSSFPLERKLTTALLGFDGMNTNVVYAQMTRGKTEYAVLSALSHLANTIGKFAMDVCLYNSQNFGFIDLPTEMTTGSSIMPHKKNPDIAEILRGRANILKVAHMELSSLLTNLPSGYHRDLQLLKEITLPALDNFEECLEMVVFMTQNMKAKKDLLNDKKYDLLFSVENVNAMVTQGVPFRDAYKRIGEEIIAGNFEPLRDLDHSLEGSIGNLMNEEIKSRFESIYSSFPFDKIDEAFKALLSRT
ncbi:argininosuccinate lyase [Marinilongibacter aquaticus]|uniref:argininosuccinate lyase n=1 Tax=Marinilongibacter aquaticus TaxID=2975157 RepID=UPI0021BD9D9F|nr:argininosuccinate lyase [Marinilongibacter aquaticus]UBM58066.1 argininosuccinate lyase [Marinilongibacter aquaticus]